MNWCLQFTVIGDTGCETDDYPCHIQPTPSMFPPFDRVIDDLVFNVIGDTCGETDDYPFDRVIGDLVFTVIGDTGGGICQVQPTPSRFPPFDIVIDDLVFTVFGYPCGEIPCQV